MAASYNFGPFRLDADAEALFRGTEPVALGRRGVALLRALVERPGALISKDALIEAAWPGLVVEQSNLTVQIAALRRLLKETPGEHRIDTLPRRGYRFVGPVAMETNGRTGVAATVSAPVLALPDKPAGNLDAYDLLLRAQQLEYEFTEESLAAALRYLEQALAIDPGYAPAMALAAYCYTWRRDQGWTKDREGEGIIGSRLASRAVELGKEDANVHWMAARAILRLQMDAHWARELAFRSLQLNPNSAIASAIAGQIEAVLGNADAALSFLARAQRLSPRDPRGWYIASGMAHAYFRQRRFDEAVSAAKRAVLQNPRGAVALRVLAASLVSQGTAG
jgi:DNA-binding winged helix-turn-helix (wHTH) protein